MAGRVPSIIVSAVYSDLQKVEIPWKVQIYDVIIVWRKIDEDPEL